MKRSKVPARDTFPRWDKATVVREVVTLRCPNDDAVMYQGPKPDFARISCPDCKAVWPVKR